MKVLSRRLCHQNNWQNPGSLFAGVAIVFSLFAQVVAASGKSVYIPSRDDSPKEYTRIPFSLEELNQPSSRYQQVFRSEEFSAVSEGQFVQVIRFSFASDDYYGTDFDANLPAVEILMGVTSRGPDELSEVFAENAANGMTVVKPKGPLRLAAATPGSARINLDVPYVYNPRQGNLLLEIRHYEPVPPPYTRPFEVPHVLDFWNVQGDAVSRVYAFDANATNGLADTGGLRTWFWVEVFESPRLSISVTEQWTNLVVRWPVEVEGCILQQSLTLGAAESWSSVGGTVTTNGTNREMVLPLDSQTPSKFYRLFLPPQAGVGSQPATGPTTFNIP